MSVVRNERIKLLATSINNVALAFIISGVVLPFITGAGSGLLTLAWLAIGIALHLCSQLVLGRMQE